MYSINFCIIFFHQDICLAYKINKRIGKQILNEKQKQNKGEVKVLANKINKNKNK